jgi:hypothetical protein
MKAGANAERHEFRDFTEAHYRRLLRSAKKKFIFEKFGSSTTKPHVLWRHDVDLSVHRAFRMARIEREEGAASTFFLLLHSEFYNLLEREIAKRIRLIVAMGHYIGLHFDPSFYGGRLQPDQIKRNLANEKRILEELVDKPVRAFSLHDPKPAILRALAKDKIAGMINVYGPEIRSRYTYCSDSNGYWRHERLADLLQESGHARLHVLTHPEWWTLKPMSPWDRVQRCVAGRASSVLRSYEQALKRDRRCNVGHSQ